MDDLISRQAAVEYIKMQRWRRFDGMTIEQAMIKMIEEVPSVQPKLIKAKIGQEQTVDETESLKKMLLGEPIVLLPSVQPEIIPLPSEQPEIIRCKDCKHYLNSNEKCALIDTRLNFYANDKRWNDDSFCSWAERE